MAQKFENIQINDVVRFYNNQKIESGVVCDVLKNKFTVRTIDYWEDNGVIKFYDSYFSFFKTGTKTNKFYLYGNAIEVIGTI